MNDKMLLAELKSIENKMDFINGIRGDYWGYKKLCFWCGSRTYDSKVGVIHTEWCAKYSVRCLIKQMENGKGTNK